MALFTENFYANGHLSVFFFFPSPVVISVSTSAFPMGQWFVLLYRLSTRCFCPAPSSFPLSAIFFFAWLAVVACCRFFLLIFSFFLLLALT